MNLLHCLRIQSFARSVRSFAYLHATKETTRRMGVAGMKTNVFAGTACAWGHINVLVWIQATYHLTKTDVQSKNNSALRCACKFGRTDIVRWLYETFQLTNEDARAEKNEALAEALTHGHLEVVRLLRFSYGLDKTDAGKYLYAVLCAKNDALDRAKFLHSTFGLKASSARGSLEMACRRNMVDVARWLLKTFGRRAFKLPIPERSFMSCRCYMRRGGTEESSASVENTLTNDDQWKETCVNTEYLVNMIEYKAAFCSACKYGSLSLVQFICKAFRLTNDKLADVKGLCFSDACSRGYLEMAQWLQGTFQLCANDVRMNGGKYFFRQLSEALLHVECHVDTHTMARMANIAIFLHATLGLTRQDVTSWLNE